MAGVEARNFDSHDETRTPEKTAVAILGDPRFGAVRGALSRCGAGRTR